MKYLRHQLVVRSDRQAAKLDEALGGIARSLAGLALRGAVGGAARWAGRKIKKGAKSWWAGTEQNPQGGIAQTIRRMSHPVQRDAQGKVMGRPSIAGPTGQPLTFKTDPNAKDGFARDKGGNLIQDPKGKKKEDVTAHRPRDTSKTTLKHKALTAAGDLLSTWERPATTSLGVARAPGTFKKHKRKDDKGEEDEGQNRQSTPPSQSGAGGREKT